MSKNLSRGRTLSIALLIVLALLSAGSAVGATTQRLYQINTGYGDMFHNYDYTQQQNFGWNTVDWGISLVFFNNAEINKVKDNILHNSGYWAGSTVNDPMWAYLDNNVTWGPGLDEDAGKKTGTPSCFGNTRHYRAYAPPTTDRFYNPDYGYYIIASTHLDNNELCSKYFDDSEGTEQNIADKMQDLGYPVWRDWANFYNYQWEDQEDGTHRFRQNGYATYIWVY